MIQLDMVPMLQDNYGYLIVAEEVVLAVDPGEAEPLLEVLSERGERLGYILVTHHHWDHIGGVERVKRETGCLVIGPEDDRLPGLDRVVRGGETIQLGSLTIEVIATPGHTKSHICYYLPKEGILFSGDTLFSGGCGRVFEGTMEEMWQSLQRLIELPGETRLYCGHEYTLANLQFALTVESANQALVERFEWVRQMRAQGHPTLPSTLELERQTNPFLRALTAERFACLRVLKDRY